MKSPYLDIDGRKVGPAHKPLVVAEIGINHGGKLEEAFKIVDSAERAGVEIIKHQTHIADEEMSEEAKKVVPSHTKENIYEIIKKCSLSFEDEIKLKKYVESKGMIFFSSPFSREAALRLNKLDVPAFKIGSGECNNYPLIELIASFGKPIILSTGMNTIETIKPAVEIFKKNKINYALMHCTNVYPTPDDKIRLNSLTQMKNAFPEAVIGLSDHSITNYPSIASVALGSSIIERHFTDTKNRIGPDIICSMDENECSQLIKASEIVHKALFGEKKPVQEENSTINFAFASVVSIKEINIGEVFSLENIWVKRPGTGQIPAKNLEDILGKISKRNIKKNVQIKLDDIK